MEAILRATPPGGRVPLSALMAQHCTLGQLDTYAANKASAVGEIMAALSQDPTRDLIAQAEALLARIEGLTATVASGAERSVGIRPRAKHALHALQSIVSARQYLHAIVGIRSAVDDLQAQLDTFDADAAVTDDSFRLLTERTPTLIDLWVRQRGVLPESSLARVYANARLSTIVSRWRAHLERALQAALLSYSWPCASAGASLGDQRAHDRVEAMLTALCELQDAFENGMFADDCWSLPHLTDPIALRFRFHFDTEGSATNRPDKPEWFLGFMSRALAQHSGVLLTLLPAVHRSAIVDAFARRLLLPVRAKLKILLKDLASRADMTLFRHCVQHVLAFEPSLADVLTKASMRAILLAVERDAANAQLNVVLEAFPAPWKPISTDALVVTTNSADALLSILFNITEKTLSKLPILVHRLEFAALQGRLLTVYTQRCEAFLELALKDISAGGVRTSATAGDDWHRFIGILNSLDCVQSVLEEWGERIVFLELQYVRSHDDLPNRATLTSADLLADPDFENTSGSFFAEERDRINALVTEFNNLLVQVVLRAFSFAAATYLSRSHVPQNAHQQSSSKLALSATICDALSTLSASLNLAAAQLCGRCFRRFWDGVARGLDATLFDGTIADKFVTRAGARQLRFDFDAVALLFRAFTASIGSSMPRMTAGLILLELPIDTVQAILDDDIRDDDDERVRAGLTPDEISAICSRILTAASVET